MNRAILLFFMIWCVIWALLLPQVVSSEEIISLDFSPGWQATHYSKQIGLPYHDITDIIQDRFGFIYFSAWGKGILRYDGYSWYLFHNKNSGLLDNVIISMAYDGKDTIYLAHHEEGVSALDIRSGKVSSLIEKKMFRTSISKILITGPDSMVITTFGDGFYTYDLSKNLLVREQGRPEVAGMNPFNWDSCRSSYIDSQGRIWIGTSAGAILYIGPNSYRCFPFHENIQQLIGGFYEDRDHVLHVVADRFIGVIDEESSIIAPSPLAPFREKLKSASCTHKNPLYQDENGLFYLFTQQGVVTYDPATGKSYEMNQDNGFLIYDYINMSYIDRENNLWIATQNGITKWSHSPFRKTEKIQNLKISLANTISNNLYQFKYVSSKIKQGKGAWLYFPNSDLVFQLENESARLFDLTSISDPLPTLIDIAHTDAGLIFRSYQGHFLYHSETASFELIPPVKLSDVLYKNKEYEFRAFARTSNDQGVERRDKRNGESIRFWDRDSNSLYELLRMDMYPLYPGSEEEFLLLESGSFYRSIYFNSKSEAFLNNYFLELISRAFTGNYVIHYIIPGREGDFWIAMHRPLGRIFRFFNNGLADFTDYFQTEDLIIEDIKLDTHGNLLITTGTDGLLVYDYKTLRHYTQSSGLPTDRLASGIGIGEEGSTYLLTLSELILFSDTAIPQPQLAPRFYEVADRYNDQSSILLPDTPGNEPFALEASMRNPVFKVLAGSFIAEQELQYQFRLTGKGDWTQPSKENSFTFTSLSPGKYTVEVRAAHIFGQKASAAFSFRILPYWYETLLARIAFILLFIALMGGIILGGIRWNTFRLERRARNLEALVNEKTHQLKEVHGQLVKSAQLAGKAEIAQEVLHNAGNILNSINISLESVGDSLKKSKIHGLFKANTLLGEHKEELDVLLKENSIIRNLLDYYLKLGLVLEEENASLIDNIESSRKHTHDLIEFIAAQEKFAGKRGVSERFYLVSLIEKVLGFYANEIKTHSIKVSLKFPPIEESELLSQQDKVLQILLNIILNSIEALIPVTYTDRQLSISLSSEKGQLRCVIRDNGIGIREEHLPRVFSFGFTTKVDHNGFSLHTCANFMTSLGGKISAFSSGPGRGAVFTLIWNHSK